MSQHKILVLPDGTHRYSNYTKYKPKTEEDRVYGRNKPDDPRAVRFYGRWFIPVDVLADEDREMPATREDSDAYAHMEITARCMCDVCVRPAAAYWHRKWRRDNGLTVRYPVRLSSKSVPGEPRL